MGNFVEINDLETALKRIFHMIILACLMVAGITCKKEKPQPAVANINIQVEVQYNSIPVTSARVFLKASTTAFPGADTTVYDWSDKVNVFGKVTFDSLFIGNYYLYSAGFNGTDSVFGSAAIVLSESDAFGVVETVLPLSK